MLNFIINILLNIALFFYKPSFYISIRDNTFLIGILKEKVRVKKLYALY